mmetsp:Transcript_12510/g.48767  ORF Transcript_12510/g.48767 Transcript_12510/m.48767 type:complete len:267 (-) Transcript_12510:23-823(-)
MRRARLTARRSRPRHHPVPHHRRRRVPASGHHGRRRRDPLRRRRRRRHPIAHPRAPRRPRRRRRRHIARGPRGDHRLDCVTVARTRRQLHLHDGPGAARGTGGDLHADVRRAVLAAASARNREPDVRVGAAVFVVLLGWVLLGRRWDTGDRGEIPGDGRARSLLLHRHRRGDALHRYGGRLLQTHRERHLGSRERLGRGLGRRVLRRALLRPLPLGGGRLLLELGEVRVALLLGEASRLLHLGVIRWQHGSRRTVVAGYALPRVSR